MVENLEKALEKELRKDTHKASIIEQVDDFIEGVAEGSILFLTAKILTSGFDVVSKEMGINTERSKLYSKQRSEIINDLIPRYIQSKGKEKKSIAYDIYSRILW